MGRLYKVSDCPLAPLGEGENVYDFNFFAVLPSYKIVSSVKILRAPKK